MRVFEHLDGKRHLVVLFIPAVSGLSLTQTQLYKSFSIICELLVLCKSKQGVATSLNVSLSNEKELFRWDSNPRHTAYKVGGIQTHDILLTR